MNARRTWHPVLNPDPRADAHLEVCRLLVAHVDPAVQDTLLDAIKRHVRLERAAAVDAYVNEEKHRELCAGLLAGIAKMEGVTGEPWLPWNERPHRLPNGDSRRPSDGRVWCGNCGIALDVGGGWCGHCKHRKVRP